MKKSNVTPEIFALIEEFRRLSKTTVFGAGALALMAQKQARDSGDKEAIARADAVVDFFLAEEQGQVITCIVTKPQGDSSA